MKRVITYIILVLSIMTLCGCKDDRTNNKLIELQSSELLNYFLDNEKSNILVAVYYSQSDNAEQYKKALNDSLSRINNNIYYVDMDHLDEDSIMLLLDYLTCDYYENCYTAISDGEVVAENTFSDYTTLINDLKNVAIIEDEIKKIDKDTKLEYLEQAQEEYDKGNISVALEYVNRAWDLDEAKKAYRDNEYYKIIDFWEAYHKEDPYDDEVKYLSIGLYSVKQDFYDYEIEGKLSEIEKPSFIKYNSKSYVLKGDIICVKNNENTSKYREKYRIIYVTDDRMQLEDLEDGKIYNYVRRADF